MHEIFELLKEYKIVNIILINLNALEVFFCHTVYETFFLYSFLRIMTLVGWLDMVCLYVKLNSYIAMQYKLTDFVDSFNMLPHSV